MFRDSHCIDRRAYAKSPKVSDSVNDVVSVLTRKYVDVRVDRVRVGRNSSSGHGLVESPRGLGSLARLACAEQKKERRCVGRDARSQHVTKVLTDLFRCLD